MQTYTSRNIGERNKGLSTRTKVGLSLLICSILLLFLTAINLLPFIRAFLLGTFGLSSYAILSVTAIIGIILLVSKKRYSFPVKYLIGIIGIFYVILCFLQLSLTNVVDYNFGDYLANTFNAFNTPAGVLAGVFVYGLSALFNVVGAYITLSLLVLVFSSFIVDQFLKSKEYQELNSRTMSFPLMETPTSRVRTPVSTLAEERVPEPMVDLVEEDNIPAKPNSKGQALTLNAKLEALQKEREERITSDPLNISARYSQQQTETLAQGNDEMARRIFGDAFINSVRNTSKNNVQANVSVKQTSPNNLSDLINHNKNDEFGAEKLFTMPNNRPKPFIHEEKQEPVSQTFDVNNTQTVFPNTPTFSNETQNQNNDNQNHNYNKKQFNQQKGFFQQPVLQNLDNRPAGNPIPINPQQSTPQNVQYGNKYNNVNAVNNGNVDDIIVPLANQNNGNETPISSVNLNPSKQKFQNNKEQLQMQQTTPTPNKITNYTRPSPYIRPPMEMLTTKSIQLVDDSADYQIKADILENTLDSFRIPAKVVAVTHGPAVTRYELQMPSGISVNKIGNHSNDIAMNLSSNGSIRIEAPIPGKNLVGIEVPNAQIATIGLRDVIDTKEFYDSKAPLTFVLGKDIAGAIKICDLVSMPHLLVAGSSGSGKSVCLNVLLISLLYKLGPDDLKLILIDPKRVEFTSYNGLPHMLTPKAINEPKQALNALDWAIQEMNNRYSLFQKMRVRDFKEYNSLEAVYKGKEIKLPRIVIVIDELADLMLLAKKDLEDKIMRLAQLARAAGIHLIIATQRPSVDVITGTIKANLPSRIAFAVTNYADSKTILDQGGADKLLGKGDMLYAPQNLPEPIRIQCPFITNAEVINIVEFIKSHNDAYFDEELIKKILSGNQQNNNNVDDGGEDGGSEFDPLLPTALKDFMKAGTGSISSIQRRHSVGFNRAARIVDQMERAGFITPADGTNKNRSVLITEEQYNQMFGNDE